jgi:hypothetical protein
VELGDAAATRVGVEAADEAAFQAGALIDKRQRAGVGGKGVGEAVAVPGGLELDASESGESNEDSRQQNQFF